MPVPPSSVPIRRALLRDDVHARLRDAIVDCTFAPGEQLRDQDLATWLGVSRTPVREALLRLGDVGLVRSEPGRSTIVAPIVPSAVGDARSVVAAMHRLAVTQAVLTEGDLEGMREANARFAAAVRAGDVEAALVADDEFHDIPVRGSGNAAVRMVLEQFTPVLRRAERSRFASSHAHESVARHDRLIEACAGGDPDAPVIAHEIWERLESPPTTKDG